MAVGSGLGSQVGIAEETVWGSAVPVTRFFPIDGSNVKPMKKSVQGQGLQAGTYVHQGSLRADTSTWVQGDMTMDFTSKQMGLLFKHALGSASIVQNGTTAAWTQTWGLGNNVNGLGLTLQGGLPQANGTVVPYTYSGCKIDQWDISCAAQDIVKSKFTFGGQATATATALATPSYPTANNIFYFKQGTVNIGGTPYLAFRDFTLSGSNNLDMGRFFFGNNGQLAEPIRNNFVDIKIAGTVDFIDTTISAAFLADTELSISLVFGGLQNALPVSKKIVTGPPDYYESFTVTLNGVRVNGDVPTIAGPGLLNIPFSADVVTPIGGGSPISIAYTSTDVAI
jgi:hypothetical protein